MLKGKSALITGSSQGIGLGVAQAFAASGAKVVVTSEKPLAKCPDVQRLLVTTNTRGTYRPTCSRTANRSGWSRRHGPRSAVSTCW
jgi:NAD(P)-dependent dehydrogenase (short-subunit alcohol dehydrogenase family)